MSKAGKENILCIVKTEVDSASSLGQTITIEDLEEFQYNIVFRNVYPTLEQIEKIRNGVPCYIHLGFSYINQGE